MSNANQKIVAYLTEDGRSCTAEQYAAMLPSLQNDFCIPLLRANESSPTNESCPASFSSWSDINRLAVKQAGRWACYVNNGLSISKKDDEIFAFVAKELKKLYPENWDVLDGISSSGMFFFDTEEELSAFYNIFSQPLTDSSAIYACTYDPDGECLTENT